MIIGVPREIMENENRVALVPGGAGALVQMGHRVVVERGAGSGSGFDDAQYEEQGAVMVESGAHVYGEADLVLKVKEPLAPEFEHFRSGQIIFTYLHLAAQAQGPLTRALLDREVTAIAYETVQPADGSLPLLTPMSQVAGRMAPQVGAHWLEKRQGGSGVLLGGVPGVPPGEVVILGGGTVGTEAARIALGLGARVTIIDINPVRLAQLEDLFGGRAVTLMSNPYNIGEAVARADLLIGAVLVPGARAPQLVSEDMVADMKPGSVIIDVAIDQGGSIATCDRVTTHADPVYERHGVIHYAVANIPGSVPRTSTLALTNVTLPYVMELARKGLEQAVADRPDLARGVNTLRGQVTHRGVAEAHGLEFAPLEQAMPAAR